MLEENGDFQNWDDIKNKSSNKINFITYYGIINSIKAFFSKYKIDVNTEYQKMSHKPSINCFFLYFDNKTYQLMSLNLLSHSGIEKG